MPRLGLAVLGRVTARDAGGGPAHFPRRKVTAFLFNLRPMCNRRARVPHRRLATRARRDARELLDDAIRPFQDGCDLPDLCRARALRLGL